MFDTAAAIDSETAPEIVTGTPSNSYCQERHIMNASQRRQFRRAVSASLGLVLGAKVMQDGKATTATLERVSPTGARNVLVKRRDNRRVVWPLSGLQAVPA